jgi:hypothetical protein
MLAACAAIQHQHAEPVRTDEGDFKNLKVLPQNIPHDELIATMRGFARALGRRCNFCHVPFPGQPADSEELDFASDAKDHKRITRGMILMTREANENIKRIGDKEGEKFKQMSCWTCHRGAVHPELTAPPRPPATDTPAPAPQPQP